MRLNLTHRGFYIWWETFDFTKYNIIYTFFLLFWKCIFLCLFVCFNFKLVFLVRGLPLWETGAVRLRGRLLPGYRRPQGHAKGLVDIQAPERGPWEEGPLQRPAPTRRFGSWPTDGGRSRKFYTDCGKIRKTFPFYSFVTSFLMPCTDLFNIEMFFLLSFWTECRSRLLHV